MVNPLYQAFKDAKATALADISTYDSSNDTFKFISNLFTNPYPQRAIFNGEMVYLLLITAIPDEFNGQGNPKTWVAQFPIPAYISRKIPGTAFYENKDNFQYIAKIIFALRNLQETYGMAVYVSNQSYRYCDQEERKSNRQALSAYKINCIGIDLDFYHVPELQGLPYEIIINRLTSEHKDLFEKLTIDIVRSGGGAQLYLHLSEPLKLSEWLHGELVYYDDAKRHFFEISNALNERFKSYGADPMCCADSARVYRAVGSCNLKNNGIVDVVYYRKSKRRYRTKLSTALEILAPEIETRHEEIESKMFEYLKNKSKDLGIDKPQKPKSSKRQKKAAPQDGEPLTSNQTATVDYAKVYVIEELKQESKDFQEKYGQQGWKNLVTNRIDDLYSVIQQKNYQITGHRNNTIFVFSTLVKSFVSDPDKLLEQAHVFNMLFSDPLTDTEVNDIVNNVIERKQQLTNRKIFKLLYGPMGVYINSLKACYTPEAQRDKELDSNKARCKKYYTKHNPKKKKYSRQQKIDIVTEHPELTDLELAEMLSCDRTTILRIRQKLQAPKSEANENTNDSIEICIMPILAPVSVPVTLDDDEEPF